MKRGQEWSENQVRYLMEHYRNERAEDIAKAIGKTKSSVQHKASRLNIGKDRDGFFNVRSRAKSGENSWNFNGYKRRTPKGYITRFAPEHPSASQAGIVMEHRLIIENALGFTLPDGFDVHHINGDKTDNRLDNLAIMTHSAHTILHNKKGKRA